MKNKSVFIKRYEKDGREYKVEYLDGSVATYICPDDDHEQFIIDTMLEQINNTCTIQNYDKEKFKRDANIISAITSSILLSVSTHNNEELAGAVMLLVAYFNICGIIKHKNNLKTLKKFKMFLEMHPDLDKINKSDFLKCIEFDNMYQIPLNINTLYDYNYGDVKILYKNYLNKIKK